MSKKGKKILLVIFIAIFTILLFNSNIVNAEINHSYPGVDTVPDEGLDKAFDDSVMLDSLARLIYWVGRFLEWIIGTIFQMLTGVSGFPWADKIVFNAVPLLDVNFINPAEGSFTMSIQELLKGVYSTILTLAFGFFGIAVLITAIKLVISSVANEKAKYKKALVDWLVGFVMLFCIHYFISFTFYLNEQLVRIASNITVKQLEGAENIAKIKRQTIVQEIIDEARKNGYKYNGELVADILEKNEEIVFAWVNYTKSDNSSKGIQEALMKNTPWWALGEVTKSDEKQFQNLAMAVKWAASENISVNQIEQMKQRTKLLASIVVHEMDGVVLDKNGNFEMSDGIYEAIAAEDLNKLFGEYYESFIKEFYYEEYLGAWKVTCSEWISDNQILVYPFPFGAMKPAPTIPGTAKEYYQSGMDNKKDSSNRFYQILQKHGAENIIAFTTDHTFYWTNVLDDLIILKSASSTRDYGEEIASGGKNNYKVRIISDLGSYFRENSYNKVRQNKTGLKNGDNIQIQNMIMYSILVGQSVILFISYIKRLFYVILLAMMAPVVVVFDFFKKFGK